MPKRAKRRPKTTIREVAHSVAYFTNVGLLVVLIGVACYSTMELASRISAQSFFRDRLEEIRGDLSDIAADGVANSLGNTDEPIGINIDHLILKQNGLITLSEQLSALEYAGARNPRATVHALQSRYEGIVTLQPIQRVVQTAERITSAPLVEIPDRIIIADVLTSFQSDKRDIRPDQFDLIAKYYPLIDALSSQGAVVYDDLAGNDYELLSAIASRNERELLRLNAIKEEIERMQNEPDDSVEIPEPLPDVELPHWAKPIGVIYNISYLPSDIILAIILISCGAIGSLFAGLRDDAPSPILRAPKGATAGFISFLVIKGGKFLFIVQATDASIFINPYASAFAGILAGLFTERAYGVLETLVSRASNQIIQEEPSERDRRGQKQLARSGSDTTTATLSTAATS